MQWANQKGFVIIFTDVLNVFLCMFGRSRFLARCGCRTGCDDAAFSGSGSAGGVGAGKSRRVMNPWMQAAPCGGNRQRLTTATALWRQTDWCRGEARYKLGRHGRQSGAGCDFDARPKMVGS